MARDMLIKMAVATGIFFLLQAFFLLLLYRASFVVEKRALKAKKKQQEILARMKINGEENGNRE